MITEFPIKLRCDELCCTALGASNNRNGTWLILAEDHEIEIERHTHSHADAKEATDHLINNGIQILIGRLRAVDLIVCVVAHAQGEKIRLCNDKVEILIKDLGDMF